MKSIEERIAALEERNQRVEADKAWEVSFLRRILILVLTYIILSLYMVAIDIQKPFLNALIPTLGFFLSTLTLQWFKKVWAQSRKQDS